MGLTLKNQMKLLKITLARLSFTLAIFNLITVNAFANSEINQKVAKEIQQKALASNLGYEILESLTVEVGPRLPGTIKDKQAVDWAMNTLNKLGFDKVYKEPVQVPIWHRGNAKAQVTSPYQQNLTISALGGSVATPKGGITAKIVKFASLEALSQAKPSLVKDKLVFIDKTTAKHKTGVNYVASVGGRTQGALEAAKKGAKAILIRSIGTDSDRFAHTGLVKYQDGVTKIPAAALSNPDADLLNAMLKRQDEVSIHLEMSPTDKGYTNSYNVIAEVTGSTKPEELVVIAAHLDSWDEGTGALDDGAGVAIVTAAAKQIMDLPQRPKRTIRVILFAAEELGLLGAKAYAKAHEQELANHYIATESDFGAGYIYRLDFKVNPDVLAQMQALTQVMTENGVAQGNNKAFGGPDISVIRKLGVPVASLRQDGQDYFDYHHTANDTLDKVSPKKLAQNIAAYAQFAYLMANSEIELR